jgi:hypothetical protein
VKRAIVLALSVILALTLVATPVALGQVEQGAQTSGATAKLAAAWWKWALSKPVAENPLIGGDPDYSRQQCNGTPLPGTTTGNKWFLAGSFGEEPVVRTCKVPSGRQFFFPVVNAIYTFTDPKDTKKLARQTLNDFIRPLLARGVVKVTVDGNRVDPNRIVRADTALFTVKVPKHGLLDPGRYRAMATGLWVTLPPLPPGKHTIHFKITSGGFDQDITYHLTVVPDSK